MPLPEVLCEERPHSTIKVKLIFLVLESVPLILLHHILNCNDALLQCFNHLKNILNPSLAISTTSTKSITPKTHRPTITTPKAKILSFGLRINIEFSNASISRKVTKMMIFCRESVLSIDLKHPYELSLAAIHAMIAEKITSSITS